MRTVFRSSGQRNNELKPFQSDYLSKFHSGARCYIIGQNLINFYTVFTKWVFTQTGHIFLFYKNLWIVKDPEPHELLHHWYSGLKLQSSSFRWRTVKDGLSVHVDGDIT